MILILGGTTEGRAAAKVVDEAGKPFFYSTLGSEQKLDARNGVRLTGGLDAEAMAALCAENGIKLIVDAAHPFAEMLHTAVADVSGKIDVSILRYERIYPDRSDDVVWCDDFDDACCRMERDGVVRLLALSGVKTISKTRQFWSRHECFYRVLDREESVNAAIKQGFPGKNLLFYSGEDDLRELIAETGADAILAKESGVSGGFEEKVCAARGKGARVYAVKRPALPYLGRCAVVNGPHGLRRQIESLLPGFFELRTGFTTGACATAASKAALMSLLDMEVGVEVSIDLPNGETVSVPVTVCAKGDGCAKASSVKDAGDDPDVTDGLVIESLVRYSRSQSVRFLQGEGVGLVTLPGLGIEVGEPAVNPVPRKMIKDELLKLYSGGLDVTISVPNGREVAKRTFNSKVGVVDGISILGTSGIVRPFSSEAYLESIAREIDVCKAVGSNVLVLNSGAKSERAVREVCVGLSSQSFVHYGNFIGDALSLAYSKGIKEVRLGIMIGKAVKLAEGYMNTHSHSVLFNRDFLMDISSDAGCSDTARESIRSMNFARELWTSLSSYDAKKFFPALLHRCYSHCVDVFPNGKLTIMLVGENGSVPYLYEG